MFLLLSRFRVEGHSMEPEFFQGEYVVISGLTYLFFTPKIGDIVAVGHPKQKGKILLKKIKKASNNNTFFVVGLNRNDSYDSGKFGPVKKQQILGKVIFKY